MKSNTALRASAGALNRLRASSSHSSVAKKLSHMALSYASPTDPIEGRTPASRQRWPNPIEVYCEPWSEWWITPFGRRVRSAMSRALSTSWVASVVAIDQPTMRRLYASSTTAR